MCALLAALSLSVGWCPEAEAGKAEADRLCEQAARAEKDAGDAERKSEERRKFLEGKGGAGSRDDAAPAGVSAAAMQSMRAQAAQARQVLPQIRQGIAAAQQDGAFAPGLSRYFQQMESCILAALPAVEACLNAPERCSVPTISCPAPPSIAPYAKNNGSTALIRKIQESYRQSSNLSYQACLNLKNAVSRNLARLKKEGEGVGARAAAGGSALQGFGDTDLYLVRVRNLRLEATRYRLDADRASGVGGYCNGRPRAAAGKQDPAALIKAVRTAGTRTGKADPGFPADGKVADLKADWDAKWQKGTTLGASDVPLTGPSAPGETAFERFKGYLREEAPWWWDKAKSTYRKADEAVGLTEFIKSRPVELAKDAVTEFLEWRLGRYGKSVTTGYKIQGAVRNTGEEVGQILVEAPRVIAHGSGTEARKLYERADRAPLKLYNDLFDDVTGKVAMPIHGSGSREGGGE